MGGGTLS
jgi:hypothetical protein